MLKDSRTKQINDALDKHLERSSPSSSRGGGGIAFKEKDRVSGLSGNGKASFQKKPIGNLCLSRNCLSLWCLFEFMYDL